MNAKQVLVLCLLLLSSLACGMVESLTGVGSSAGTVSELWPDVPEIEGANTADMEMPLGFRLMLRAVTQGGVEYITYTTDKTAAEVQAFYTVERMAEEGWEAADLNGNETDALSCVGDTTDSSSEGVLCLFRKEEDGKEIMLAMVVAENGETEQTEVFYARIDASQFVTPTAGPEELVAATATAQAALPPLVEQVLPAGSAGQEFVYGSVNFKVTQAVINNRDLYDPNLTLADAFHAEFKLTADNQTPFTIFFENGALTIKFSDGTEVRQPFGGGLGPNQTMEFTASGPVAAGTTWDGASLTIDEIGKEPFTVPLTGEVSPTIYPVVPLRGAAVTGQNERGETMDYEVVEGVMTIDGPGGRAPLGKRFIRVTLNVTNGAPGGILVSGADFKLRADGVLSDMVYDETGGMTPSTGVRSQVIVWFLIPAEARELVLVGNVWEAAAEIGLSRQ